MMLLGLYLKSNDKLKLFGNSDEDEKESELDYNEDKDQQEEKQEKETGETTLATTNHIF